MCTIGDIKNEFIVTLLTKGEGLDTDWFNYFNLPSVKISNFRIET